MNNSTDDIKVKEEPVESEEEQQKMDLSSSNIKPESPVPSSNASKSKETKKLHRKIFFFNFTSHFSFHSSCFHM
jgi:hypothetical protein